MRLVANCYTPFTLPLTFSFRPTAYGWATDLLYEGGDGDGVVRTAGDGGQRGEAGHEEVEARERDHVDGQLAQVRVELAREPETRRHAFTQSNTLMRIHRVT